MLKKDLLTEVAAATGHPEKLVREILASTTACVLSALAGGRSVMLLGLGKLSTVRRGAKQARNLHTKEAVTVPPRNDAVLRPSDAVRDAINPADPLAA